MDLAAEELLFLSITDIIKESIAIPKQSPKTFYLVTLTLIFPLSFAILAHSLFTHPILSQLQSDPVAASSDWSKLLIFQFFYLIFLFSFSLLSTAAVVFTVASLYTSKPVSFSSTISAIPSVFRRLFITFLWVSLTMVTYNIIFLGFLVLLIIAVDTQNVLLFLFSLVFVFLMFLVVHVYISALWHLASVVSVVEPVYGLAAMKKSYELLNGKTSMGFTMVFGYFSICGMAPEHRCRQPHVNQDLAPGPWEQPIGQDQPQQAEPEAAHVVDITRVTLTSLQKYISTANTTGLCTYAIRGA
ncbi:hypothetical protein ACS0TY_018413 [Phlomoides rotata]